MVKSTKQKRHKQQHDPRIIALVKLLARGAAVADIQAESQNNPRGEKPCYEPLSTPDIPQISSETNP